MQTHKHKTIQPQQDSDAILNSVIVYWNTDHNMWCIQKKGLFMMSQNHPFCIWCHGYIGHSPTGPPGAALNICFKLFFFCICLHCHVGFLSTPLLSLVVALMCLDYPFRFRMSFSCKYLYHSVCFFPKTQHL